MIKNIHPRGRYMQVIGGSASTYINGYGGAQGVGNLRYNTNNQQLEVYDGNSWTLLNMPDATVGLNEDAEMLLDWARKKKHEEEVSLSLPSDHPAVKLAKDNINRAKQALKEAEDQLKITLILSEEHEKSTS
jgi:hypothetical protein